MKLLITSIAIIFLSAQILVSQSNFAPIGAKWIYGYEQINKWQEPFYHKYALTIIESQKDTMIDNKLCKKLLVSVVNKDANGNRLTTNYAAQYIHQDGYKIFHYRNAIFYPILDFNLLSNQSMDIAGWDIYTNRSMHLNVFYQIKSNETTQQFGPMLAKITTSSICTKPITTAHHIIERIGYLHDLFIPSGIYCFFEASEIHTLRCYSDPEIGLIKFTSDDCEEIKDDQLSTKIKDPGISKKFQLSPNPTNGDITLQYNDQKLDFDIQVQIMDINGKEILIQDYVKLKSSGQIHIPTNGFNNGIYILHILSNHKTISSQKIIINK